MYIFDIDGTLADADHRLHHIIDMDTNERLGDPDWDQFFSLTHLDTPIIPMVELAQTLYATMKPVVLLTGRNSRCRTETEEWMLKHKVPYDDLLMRREGDHRPDYVVKLELLDNTYSTEELNGIKAIFEDRKCVTAAFRKRGYLVCQVAEGNY